MTDRDSVGLTAAGASQPSPDPAPAMRYVNGVFKGGGAKGIAYLGALQALHARGVWFKSVAGASAGAVTAALIASGMDLDELATAVPDALASAKAPLGKRLGEAVIGRRSSIFDSVGIRDWLDGAFRRKIGKTDPSPVTFAELYEASRIELYVVAMDLASGSPMVLCRRTTPTVDVAGAVAASSAIPGAFPAARGVFMSEQTGATVHALVDGGTWANYPAFVFQDQSFRAWLRGVSEASRAWTEDEDELWRQECDRALVGFVLGEPDPLEDRTIAAMVPTRGRPVSPWFDRGPTYTSPNRGLYLVDLMLSNAFVRLVLLAAVGTWVVLTLSVSPLMARRLAVALARWMPDWLFPFAVVGVMSMVVIAAIVAVALVMFLVLVGRLIGDTLIPSMKALVAVPTGVAPWVGLGNDVVVLNVPCKGLETTGFAVDDETRNAAVALARQRVGAQLDDPSIDARLRSLLDGKRPQEEPRQLTPSVATAPTDPDRLTLVGVVSVVAAACLIGWLAWKGISLAEEGEMHTVVLTLFVGTLVGGAAMLFLGGRAAARSHARSRFGVRPSDRHSPKYIVLGTVAGIALLLFGAALSDVAMDDQEEETSTATVVGATLDDTDFDRDGIPDATYDLVVKGRSAEFSLTSDRRLRMNERVFVDFDDETGQAELASALDEPRFGYAIVMWILGIGLLISARRRHIWHQRCRHLAALTADLASRGS